VITKQQFADEFAELAYTAGIRQRCGLDFPNYMAERNDADPRAFAEVDVEALHFFFAPQILDLPRAHRRGLIMHELGHVLTPGGSEQDADRAAEAVFGVKIKYDCRWPGKGLQRANPEPEIAHRVRTKDGYMVQIWEDGLVTDRMGNSPPGRGGKTKLPAEWIDTFAHDAENYNWDELAKKITATRKEKMPWQHPRYGMKMIESPSLQRAKKTEADQRIHLGKLYKPNPAGYKVAYLERGQRTHLDDVFTLKDAQVYMVRLKRRGMTAWVEREDGTFVPVAGAKRRPAFLEENPVDLDRVPSIIHGEMASAEARAVAAGANPETLDYLGAGAEGILFVDGDIAYKVGRKRSLKNEAIALAELDAAGAPVPWFQRYDAENDVIVREHIEGRPGGWGDDRVLRELYDQQIVPALRRIDFSCGEFKENSFIITESGQPVMVDLGFLCPIGQRAVRELTVAMDELSPDDSYFDLQTDIRFVLSDGDITPEQANEWADQLADVFGEDTVRDLRESIRFIGGQ
jgi:hypothetical protein